MSASGAERQRAYRQRKAQTGKTRLSIYLGENGRARLAFLAERWNCSSSVVVGRLLREAVEAEAPGADHRVTP